MESVERFLNREGILCRSPRSCIKEAFSIGLIKDEYNWLDILDDRNLSVHTYDEELAEQLYSRLKSHHKAMKSLLEEIKEKLN